MKTFTFGRRDFFRISIATGAGVLIACSSQGSDISFPQGVASGDPSPDRNIRFPDGMYLGDKAEDGIVAWTLRDYRMLYRTWRSDHDLKKAHQMLPFVSVWDDHEFANDSWQDPEGSVERVQFCTRSGSNQIERIV